MTLSLVEPIAQAPETKFGERTCVACGKKYGARATNQKHCSVKCRDKCRFQRASPAYKARAIARTKEWAKKYPERQKAASDKHRAAHREEHRQKTLEYQRTPKGKYVIYKKSAVQRGIGFSITEAAFVSFWGKPCTYCGAEILTVGLDRMDSDKGYTTDNVVSCCADCNYGKRTRAPEEFIEHCHRVALLHPLGRVEENR